MNPLKRKRRRIFLLFVLGIGVPSLLLGYLAFRGIQNDQALLEKQDREELRISAVQVTAEVDNTISRAEEMFMMFFESFDYSANPDDIQNLLELKAKAPLVDEVILFHEKSDIHFPTAKLLYSADGSLETVGISSQSLLDRRQMQSGQQVEFQEKNFRRAAGLYQEASMQIQNPREKGELLNALARVQRKASLVPEAIDTYNEILENYSQVRSSSGIPLGLAASSERAALLATAENPENALKASIDLYRKKMDPGEG
jgi:tetratricopeptide (TPR) repeat protein